MKVFHEIRHPNGRHRVKLLGESKRGSQALPVGLRLGAERGPSRGDTVGRLWLAVAAS